MERWSNRRFWNHKDMEALSFEEAKQMLVERGWSEDGATFIAERRYDERAIPLLKRLGAKIKAVIPSRSKKKSIPNSIRWAVWERDNFTCLNCGSRKYLSVDHIIPESKGGTLDFDNLQMLCQKCNSRKGAR